MPAYVNPDYIMPARLPSADAARELGWVRLYYAARKRVGTQTPALRAAD